MSLFPTYTSPPDIGWVSALWADDAKNRSHPNNPNASIEKIQATYGGNVLGLTLGSSRPHFITQSQYLGNRGAWVADAAADGIWGNMVDQGQQMTLVAVAAYTAIPGAGVPHMAYTGNIGLSNSGGGVRVVGSNNDSIPYVRLSINTPILYTAYTNRPTTSNVRSSLNGNQFIKGQLNNGLTSSTIGLGTTASGGNSGFWHMGFYGIYQGDATTSPYWSDFLDWVQSHYGFDPRSTYDTSLPPPIDWKAEYLADDFNQSAGTWTDRTGRGYTMSPGTSASTAGLTVVGTPSATNSAKVNWFSGLHFTGDFEVQAKVVGVLPTASDIGGCGAGSASTFRWTLSTASGRLVLTTSNGGGYIGYTSTSPLPTGYESLWVRATWTKNEGGNAVGRFYYGWDGVNWTQLGNAVSFATFSLPTGGNLPCYMGGFNGAVASTISPAVLQKFRLLNGIGGPAILDIDFTANAGSSSFTESSANAQTVNVSPGTPLKVTNVVNGQPVVRFDGVDDYLKASSVSLVAPLSVVAIARAGGTVTGPTFVGSENSVGRAIAGDTVTPGWVTRLITNNNIGAGGTSPSNWNLIRMYDNGSTGGVFAVNETVLASGLTIGASGITDLVLAAQQGGLSGFSDVDIAYVALFSGDVTQSTLWSTFKTWVTNKYGITVA